MVENFEKTKEILKKYNQEHLLSFYDELDEDKKNLLCNQICNMDFEQIFNLYEKSKSSEDIPISAIDPLDYYIKDKLSKEEFDFYTNIGETCIRNNQFAVVTMAGGQGTRLGYKGPKGTFELDIIPKKSLFEILCDNLKEANNKYNVTITWYIMTSVYNHYETINYFEEKNYFGYPKEYIKFFNQSELPLIDTSGNLILEEIYKVKQASNGNGDVFDSMKRNGIIDDIKSKNIEWLFFSGIDNVILEIVDPLFIGLTINKQMLIAAKTLFKQDYSSSEWVFVKKNGKPSIIDCNYLSEAMKVKRDDNGKYLYREMNVLAHIFHISAIEKICNISLPYHRAFKKNDFINEEGMKQIPEKPNTYKFEKFIFDAFSLFDDMLLLRVEADDEFAPIKDFTGPHNPEVAKELYKKKHDLK